MLILRAESQVGSDLVLSVGAVRALEVDNCLDRVLFRRNYLLGYGIKLLLGGFTYF